MKFDDVVKYYNGKKVLDELSFEAEKGRAVCLFGPSGVGKTTALNIIAGICRPDGGEVIGTDGKISYVFQDNRLLKWFTAKENIMMTAVNKKSAQEFIHISGLQAYLDIYPEQMSGGMKKITAIARAIGHDGDIFLLDEPFNGIDKSRIEAIAEYIRKITYNKICIMVTHSQYESDLLNAKIIKINNNCY